MPRPRLVPALAGVALCSVLVAGCGSGGPPSQSEARDEVQDQLVDQGVGSEQAADIADCVTAGLFESGDFTKEERDDVLQATDGSVPPEPLVTKTDDLVNGCAEEFGVTDLNPTGAPIEADESTTTSTAG